jgi:hypothetical protein
MAKIILNSDFRDYYDHAFDKDYLGVAEDTISFHRPSSHYSRAQALDFLADARFVVPERGTVAEVYTSLLKQTTLGVTGRREGGYPGKQDIAKELFAGVVKVVVYLDEYSHRGEDKLLLDLDYAVQHFPHYYCTEYVGGMGSSIRMLQVGKQVFWLKYTTTRPDEWRSNVDPQVELLRRPTPGYFMPVSAGGDYPMFAIDFVGTPNGTFFALDFNISPSWRHTPVEGLLPASDVYILIRNYYRDIQGRM